MCRHMAPICAMQSDQNPCTVRPSQCEYGSLQISILLRESTSVFVHSFQASHTCLQVPAINVATPSTQQSSVTRLYGQALDQLVTPKMVPGCLVLTHGAAISKPQIPAMHNPMPPSCKQRDMLKSSARVHHTHFYSVPHVAVFCALESVPPQRGTVHDFTQNSYKHSF
jgi:hypothetical protein